MNSLQRYKHDTYPIVVEVVDGSGAPVSLAGDSVEFRVLDNTGATVNVLSVSVVDASRGVANVDFSTTVVPPGTYSYVIGLQDSAGFYRVIDMGQLVILEDFHVG